MKKNKRRDLSQAKNAKDMRNWTLKTKDCQHICKQESPLFLCLVKKFELTINFKCTAYEAMIIQSSLPCPFFIHSSISVVTAGITVNSSFAFSASFIIKPASLRAIFNSHEG